MAPELFGFLGIGVLLLLMLTGMPIAFCFIVVGSFGLLYFVGLSGTLFNLASVPWVQGTNFVFAAIPLYILMGTLAEHAGITRDLFGVIYRWIGWLPGGLGVATIGACGGFAAISGSSVATAAAIGKVTYNEMTRYKYLPRFAAGTIAAGGTIGTLIPPSLFFIIYGLLTETSVASLFMAGVLPGLLVVICYSTLVFVLAKMNPALAPHGPSFTWREKVAVLPSLAPALLLIIVVLGGIYGGFFTPTEAAAVGVSVTFLIMVIRGCFTWERLVSSLWDAAQVTGMLFAIIIGAMIFNAFIAYSGIPPLISRTIIDLGWPATATLVAILLMYLPLGCFMDAVGMVLLTLPMFIPTLKAFHLDFVWIGVLIVCMMEIGLITPPLGLNVYVISGVSKLPLGEVFRGVYPFVLVHLSVVAILVMFPQISLFLPGMMLP